MINTDRLPRLNERRRRKLSWGSEVCSPWRIFEFDSLKVPFSVFLRHSDRILASSIRFGWSVATWKIFSLLKIYYGGNRCGSAPVNKYYLTRSIYSWIACKAEMGFNKTFEKGNFFFKMSVFWKRPRFICDMFFLIYIYFHATIKAYGLC